MKRLTYGGVIALAIGLGFMFGKMYGCTHPCVAQNYQSSFEAPSQ